MNQQILSLLVQCELLAARSNAVSNQNEVSDKSTAGKTLTSNVDHSKCQFTVVSRLAGQLGLLADQPSSLLASLLTASVDDSDAFF